MSDAKRMTLEDLRKRSAEAVKAVTGGDVRAWVPVRRYKDYASLPKWAKLEVRKSLHAEQDGRCKFCDGAIHDPGVSVVDHDHVTDEIRGLAHASCNDEDGGWKG